MQTKQIMTKTAVAVAFALSAGCASQQTSGSSQVAPTSQQSAPSSQVAPADQTAPASQQGASQQVVPEAEVAMDDTRSADLDAREAALNARDAAGATASCSAEAPTAACANMPAASGNELLPPAKPGECYARIWVPATYRSVSEKLVASEASERIEVIPAVYEWTTETVEVSAPSSRLVTTPAVYGTETETILVSDASTTWRRSLGKNAALAGSGLLEFARAHGADIDSATPGMCFHEHTIPATFTTESDQVLVSEASESVSVTPATYTNVQKTITVSEASTKIVQVPAVYKTVSEKILVKAAHTVWKKGTGPIQRIDSATGEIMCLIEVPAEYKTVTKQVVVTPATTRTIDIPAVTKTISVREQATAASEQRTPIAAKYKTVSRRVKASEADVVWHEIHNTDHSSATRTGQQVCLTETPAVYKTVSKRVVKTPASSHEVVIPGTSKTVKVQRLATPASERRIVIPETYKTVSRQELVKDGYMQWRSILCETNTTRARISQIQRALKTAGYNPGPIDGVVGSATIRAVNAFQKSKGLPVDKYLNVETIKALGVSVK